ncbi:GntR family transcriptional regulator [Nitrincola sp.]|uniref:GntR family transcriptional regulator n=1 Tax=Nitrincola sp. TaxID=1926584 RepID=UPI003A92675D
MTTDASGRHRVIDVMNTILTIGVDGITMEEIADALGVKYQPVRRALEALEQHGWVQPYRRKGSNQILWMPGKWLIRVAFQYKQQQLTKQQTLKDEFHRVTGEVLDNGR